MNSHFTWLSSGKPKAHQIQTRHGRRSPKRKKLGLEVLPCRRSIVRKHFSEGLRSICSTVGCRKALSQWRREWSQEGWKSAPCLWFVYNFLAGACRLERTLEAVHRVKRGTWESSFILFWRGAGRVCQLMLVSALLYCRDDV